MDANVKGNGRPFGVRPDEDVELLIERAMDAREFRSVNRLANHALRKFLTPKFANAKILKMQKEIAA